MVQTWRECLQVAPAGWSLLCGACLQFLCFLGCVGGHGEELGFAEAPCRNWLQSPGCRAHLPPRPPALSSLPPPQPLAVSHNELVLIAPQASAAVGVAALISKLPSQGGQARLPAALSPAAAAVAGGEAAVPAGFVPALPSFPRVPATAPRSGWVRAGWEDGCGQGMGAGGRGDGCECGRLCVGLSL